MMRLTQGSEPEERIDLFLKFTSIKSSEQIKNLKRYYCNGWSEEHLTTAGVDIGNFRRAVKVINGAVEIYDKLCEFDGRVRQSVK